MPGLPWMLHYALFLILGSKTRLGRLNLNVVYKPSSLIPSHAGSGISQPRGLCCCERRIAVYAGTIPQSASPRCVSIGSTPAAATGLTGEATGPIGVGAAIYGAVSGTGQVVSGTVQVAGGVTGFTDTAATRRRTINDGWPVNHPELEQLEFLGLDWPMRYGYRMIRVLL